MKRVFEKELLDEIAEVVDIRRESYDKKTAPIIFDGKQFTIKIPKKIAAKAGIAEDDLFEFVAASKLVNGEHQTRLEGRLVKHSEKNPTQD